MEEAKSTAKNLAGNLKWQACNAKSRRVIDGCLLYFEIWSENQSASNRIWVTK